MTSDDRAKVYSVDDKKQMVEITGKKTFERHPDGGLRPIDPKERGDISLPCPACRGPLIRDSGLHVWQRSVVRCPNPECGELFAGKLYPPKPKSPKRD